MAEELDKYLMKMNVRSRYIHSDVDTLERVEILSDLRCGLFDVLVGVNLLREGLDLPEVSLVAILDADKEGFLRSSRSLTQTVGRAARNVHGKVIMYADVITKSMQQTLDETDRRREKQLAYNTKHGITPRAVSKQITQSLQSGKRGQKEVTPYKAPSSTMLAADPVIGYMTRDQLEKTITKTKKQMEKEAKDLNFMEAARLRDEMYALKELFTEKFE